MGICHQGLGFMDFLGPCFFFKGLALPWFGSPLADFLQVLAFSGSWFFAPRTKERNQEQKKDVNKERNKDRTKEGNEEKKEREKERNKENLA